MKQWITVTIPGGTLWDSMDTPKRINADNILSIIDDSEEDYLSKSIITMSDGSRISAKETSKEIEEMRKKK